MPEAVALGPVVLPVARVAVLVALVAGVTASGRFARRRGLDADAVGGSAEIAAAAFVLGARLGHVAAHPEAYREAPWAALYLWQPGFVPWVGGLAAAVVLVPRVLRCPPGMRRRHAAAVGSGALIAVAAFAAVVGAARVQSGPPAVTEGDPLPEASFRTLAGEAASLGDLRGEPLVLNLWATWCGPCRREMPALQALHEHHREAGLQVVGISVGEGPAAVRAFLRETPVDYPLWLDPPGAASGTAAPSSALHGRLGGFGLPTTVFVDGSGVIRSIRVGALSRPALDAAARSLLAPP